MLVRTGQTAALSVTTSGPAAPTLQWQSRAANSNDAGAMSPPVPTPRPLTTSPRQLMPGDNGTQYRMVATNPVGIAASSAVTVSVSDLDVAPTIATQPANLSVPSGGDAIFAIDARGTEALSYQWFPTGVAMAGANSPVLAFDRR